MIDFPSDNNDGGRQPTDDNGSGNGHAAQPDPRFADDPTTRNGTPRIRARRASPREKIERIRTAMNLLAAGMTKREIREIFLTRFKLKSKSVNRYISAARKAMRAIAGKPMPDLVAEAVHFYMAVLRNEGAGLRDKLAARGQLDSLLGLRVNKHALVTKDGGDVLRSASEPVPEPVSQEESEAKIKELYASLVARDAKSPNVAS